MSARILTVRIPPVGVQGSGRVAEPPPPLVALWGMSGACITAYYSSQNPSIQIHLFSQTDFSMETDQLKS